MNNYILKFEKTYRLAEVPLHPDWSTRVVDDTVPNQITVEHAYEFSLKIELADRVEEVVNLYVRKNDIQHFECLILDPIYTGEFDKENDVVQVSFCIK